MSHYETGLLSTYNSLTDPNLAGFFTNRRLQKHLRRSGLVARDGRIVSETTYRMYWTRREQQFQMHEILAKAILNKTLDMERTRQAEIRKRIDEISKLELVRCVRGDKEHNRRENTFPLLTTHSSRSREVTGLADDDEKRRTRSAGAPHRSSHPRISARTSYEPYQETPHELLSLHPAPPQGQRALDGSARPNYRRLQSARPAPTQVRHDESFGANVTLQTMNQSTVRMHYFGPNLKLDTAAVDFQSTGDLIIVEQQPAGCGTLTVFRGHVKRGSDFTFESRRYRTHTFSLTLFVNEQQDCRLNTCCEYKHKLGARLGGVNGHFAIASVDGSGPCYRCQFEEEEKKEFQKKKDAQKEQKKKMKERKAAIDKEKEQNKKEPEQPVLKIAVETVEEKGADEETSNETNQTEDDNPLSSDENSRENEEPLQDDENSDLLQKTFEVFEHNTNADLEDEPIPDEKEEADEDQNNEPEVNLQTDESIEKSTNENIVEPSNENIEPTYETDNSQSDCASCCSDVSSSSTISSRPRRRPVVDLSQQK